MWKSGKQSFLFHRTLVMLIEVLQDCRDGLEVYDKIYLLFSDGSFIQSDDVEIHQNVGGLSDNTINVTEHIKSESCGGSHSSPTRKSVSRSCSAGPSQEYSNVRTGSHLSAVSSATAISGRAKVRTGNITPDTKAIVSLARARCARRSFEGGPISEDRFWEMQAESYRLKRDLVEKEEQNKALGARLNRAEGAVKRKLRASVENISLLPKEKLSALAVLTQNYNTEKKVEELEERLRVCLRDNSKYLQHVRRYKAETEWFKRRLDATIRASGRARSCSCQHSLKRYEKMVKDLRKQVSGLRKKKDCKSCCASSESDALLGISELSAEDQICPTEIASSGGRSGLHFLGTASDPADKSDTGGPCFVCDPLEEAGRYGTDVQRPSATVHSVAPKAMEGPLQETLVEQSICDTLSTFDLTTQLMATLERLKIVTIKYNRAMEELRLLQLNQESYVQKLQDTHRKLNQERRNCLKLEVVEKKLSSELMAAKHLEPLLQQVRQQNVQLEIENAELVASALNVPRTSFSELNVLRQQLVKELKQRKVAEAKTLNVSTQLEECKQDLARLAVVEANWEFLKSELAAAKAAIKELKDSNKRLQKQIHLKGQGFMRMDAYTSVSMQHGAPCEEEENTHLHEERTQELECEPECGSAGEDNRICIQDGKPGKYGTSSIGLQALRLGNKDDMSNFGFKKSQNIAVKLCSSVPPNYIIMTIHGLELNACTDLSSIKKVSVCFQFLAEYCEPDDQRTPLVSNNQAVLHFSYSRAFFVDQILHRDARESLKKMLKLETTAYVQFQVWGEAIEGRPKILLGSCQVDLWAAMYQAIPTDLLETKLEVLSKSSVTIGNLDIGIHGLELLRDIHGLSMPSSPFTPHLP